MGQVTADMDLDEGRPSFAERLPALSAAAALAAGIVLDRQISPHIASWALTAAVFIAVALLIRRQMSRLATLLIVAAFVCIGGIRHHLVWFTRAEHDIARVDISDDAPVRLVGVIDSAIEIIPSQYSPSTPTFLLTDRSVCALRCEWLIGPSGRMPVSGLVRLDAEGHLLHARQGDRVEVLGKLRIPQPPRSSGDFDFPSWLRAQGIDRVLGVDHPEAVRVLDDASDFRHRWGRLRERLRRDCDRVLAASLSRETYPVGTSLLLGTRSGLTDEVRDAFIYSGTMHLLAISGLHVAILAGCVVWICRGLNVSFSWTIGITLAVLVGYTVVTDLRPPVLRSAMLGCLVAAATPGARRGSGLNLLAATAFLLMLWNPCDLYDIGAQLSFLAVAAIIWSARLMACWPRRSDPLLLDADLPMWKKRLDRFTRWIAECYIVTAAIWIFTLPITMAWFHLISPVGFLINVVLLPFSFPLLAAGFLTLALGLLWQPLAFISAWGYDLCLRLLIAIVRWSAGLSWSHWTVPGPSGFALVWFYGLLSAAVLLPWRSGRQWSWRVLSATVVLSLVWGLRPAAREGLTCTFVDVGHGGAVLFELPGGRTVLYDAGSFGRSERARRAIEQALMERRINRLDALVISHADTDHFNAAADLFESLPTGGIYFSQGFLDVSQPGVMELCNAARAKRIPLIILQAGDRLTADPDVEISLLHPAGTFEDDFDNANSIVFDVRYAGRRILLTGDLERSGLVEVLKLTPDGRTDVLQAPHHGSRASNTPELDRWATPSFVVASNSDPSIEPRLIETYSGAEKVFTTAGSGTISFRLLPSGEIRTSSDSSGGESASPDDSD